MSSYKLYYFPIYGRGELIRFVFAQAGVDYEDICITGEDWGKTYKEKSPFGCMPYLEEDGKSISGTSICAQYLAEKYGLAGDDAFQNAEIASVGDAISDLVADVYKPFFEKDESKKAELVKDLKEVKLPMRFKYLQRQADKFDQYFFGKLTWVDFAFFLITDVILKHHPTAVDDFPKLKAIMSKVPELPNIKAWIEKRPKTEF